MIEWLSWGNGRPDAKPENCPLGGWVCGENGEPA